MGTSQHIFSPQKIYSRSSHFLRRRNNMKNSVLVLCLGLTLGVALVDSARSCRFPRDEEKSVFRVGGSAMNCAELVVTYPKFACLNNFIKRFKCCNQCSVAEAQGEVTCEDKAECANMPRSGCGNPQRINACPKKCRRCR